MSLENLRNFLEYLPRKNSRLFSIGHGPIGGSPGNFKG